jgi:hypothetical protein
MSATLPGRVALNFLITINEMGFAAGLSQNLKALNLAY